MAEEQQWEYCQLSVQGQEEVRKPGGVPGKWYSYVRITYYGTSVTTRVLSTLPMWDKNAQYLETGAFSQTLGQLGRSGWELTNIQHSNALIDGGRAMQLSYGHIVAYLKRPMRPGRAIHEPQIVIS